MIKLRNLLVLFLLVMCITASCDIIPTVTITPDTATPTSTITITDTVEPTQTDTKTATHTNTITVSPTLTHTKTATHTNTATITPSKTLTNTYTVTPTYTFTPTMTLTRTPGIPTVTSMPTTYFYAGFEYSNLVEYNRVGEFIHQRNGYYQITDQHAHTGNQSVALVIDTVENSGDQAAYLFVYGALNSEANYYSAWYYIPSGTEVLGWWNIMQWKSTPPDSIKMASLNAYNVAGGMRMNLLYKGASGNNIIADYGTITVPFDEWFNIEVYYPQTTEATGVIRTWLNGEPMHEACCYATMLSNRTVFWSVNNYSDEIRPAPAVIFVDDIRIAGSR